MSVSDRTLPSIIPALCAGAAMIVFAAVLVRAIDAFHRSVDDWAARDLANQTELAAKTLGEHLDNGDFTRIRAFGEEHKGEGLRLTLIGRSGKPIYDSHVAVLAAHADRPEVIAARRHTVGSALRRSASTGTNTLYCARAAADGTVVRFAIPYDGLIEPVRRAHTGLLLAGVAGGSALLLVFLFTNRLAARARLLARERDEKIRRLEEMERRETFRREFVANVTHEIKTPVTGILGAADMLTSPGLSPADRETLLDLLKKESHHLDLLAHNVLDLARLEHDDSAAYAFARHDVVTILRNVRTRLGPRAAAAGTTLTIDAPATLSLPCNPDLLEQALANLVENALRYSGSPEVILSACRDGENTCLAVEDHGTGIPPEHRDRIFERFYRVDKDRSRTAGGTGLGLAIVKHIARLHGGDATLELPTGGQGCRFVLSLRPAGPS